MSNDEVQIISTEKYTFSVPMSPDYTYQVMLPLIEISLRSPSQTLIFISEETAQMVAYFTQTDLFPRISNLGRKLPDKGENGPTPALNLMNNLYKY